MKLERYVNLFTQYTWCLTFVSCMEVPSVLLVTTCSNSSTIGHLYEVLWQKAYEVGRSQNYFWHIINAAFRLACRWLHCPFDADICTTTQVVIAAEA